MASLKPVELKFLLKLIGCEGYTGRISALSPNSKTKASERNRICEHLGADGYVEYDSQVSNFTITQPGKALLNLDTTSLPVTPDELAVLRSCKGSMTPSKIGSQIPSNSRQRLIQNLAERGLLKVTKSTIKDVRLTDKGKRFLRDEYEPSGSSYVATGNMLANYVSFLRATLGQAIPSPQTSAADTNSQDKPNAEEVLRCILKLDHNHGTDNYLPIYYLRDELQPPLSREELDSRLYSLQRADRIELSSLHDQGDYSDRQLSAGIPQANDCSLFFVSVL